MSTPVDLVIGSRFLRREGTQFIPTSKVAANAFGTMLLNRLLRLQLTDVASGMRGLGPRALDLTFGSENFAFAFEIITKTRNAQLRLSEVPIHVRYDAIEPFTTSTPELLDFLGFARGLCTLGQPDMEAVEQLERGIAGGRSLRVCLNQNIYYFHPLGSRGYQVHEQHRWFVSFDRPESGFDFVTFL